MLRKLSVFLILLPGILSAQPVLSTARTVAGLQVYDDLTEERQHYYLPGELALAREADGRPKFKLLQMRYTGTGLAGDQGERGFVNVVQLAVARRPVPAERLAAARRALGPGRNLDPIPLLGMDAHLVIPHTAGDGRPRRIGRPAELGGGGAWEERYFTLRLGAREGELLGSDLEAGRTNLSVNYAYYASAVNDQGGDYRLRADSATLAELEMDLGELVAADSVPARHVVLADAFPLELDLTTWPDLLQRVDLNEEQTPTWAFLEVRCYDFANALRPDLGMKTVEIEATSVGGTTTKLKPIRFLAGRPEYVAEEPRFRYAVDVRKPYRYRVTEYSTAGDMKSGQWLTAPNWSDLLDVTTPAGQIPYVSHAVELEADTAAYRAAGAELVSADLIFQRDGRLYHEEFIWRIGPDGNGSPPLRLARFYADRDAPVRCVVRTVTTTGRLPDQTSLLAGDGYLHLRPRP